MADKYEPSEAEISEEFYSHIQPVGTMRNVARSNLKRIHAALVAAAKAERERCAKWHVDKAQKWREVVQKYGSGSPMGAKARETACSHEGYASAIRALPIEEGK